MSFAPMCSSAPNDSGSQRHRTSSRRRSCSLPASSAFRLGIAETAADLRTRRAEAEDRKASIYYDVRGAFLDLQASSEQLQVATRARDLAAQQLVQARDRFTAGVTNNVEVVQAQEAVAL